MIYSKDFVLHWTLYDEVLTKKCYIFYMPVFADICQNYLWINKIRFRITDTSIFMRNVCKS